MFHREKFSKMAALVLAVGMALALSGCATCNSCDTAAPAPKAGLLHGSMGCDDCEKPSSPLIVEKQMPSQIVVGKPYTYTILVTNKSACGLDDVTVTERIPEQYEMSSAVPEATKVSGRVAEWALGYLAPKEQRTITINGLVNAAGATTACTKANYNPTLCLGPEAISPSLSVALEAPSQAMVCDLIPVKVTVTNTGTGYAQDVKVMQALPQGLVTQDGKTSLSMDIGDLAGGASKTYTVGLKASQPGSFSNAANAEAANGLSAASQAVTTVVSQPALKVNITGPDKVFVTKDATYQVTAQNVGNATSANTVVQATIPSGMQFVSASQGGQQEGDAVTWRIGDLEAGKEVQLSATYRSVRGGSGQSVARAVGVCCEEASAAVKSDIEGIPAILLEVIDTDDPIKVGDQEKYYVTVTNQGSASDKNVVVKVEFEENIDYLASAGPTQGTSDNVKSVTFAPLASLEAGQKATWEISGKAVKEGDHRTTVVMTSDAIGRPVQETEATRIY